MRYKMFPVYIQTGDNKTVFSTVSERVCGIITANQF